MTELPSRFIDSIHHVFGDAGREWLPRLPEIVACCRAKWRLREGEVSSELSLNYVEFTATSSGDPVVLKIGVPHAELLTEMEALRLYGGRRAVRLLDSDRELGGERGHLHQRPRPRPGLLTRHLRAGRSGAGLAGHRPLGPRAGS